MLMNRRVRFAAALSATVFSATILLTLAACNDGGGSSAVTPAAAAPASISGSPVTSASVGTAYSFHPTINAMAGASLSFSVMNQPAWTQFDAATGTLSGTPAATDVGIFADVVISVSDGAASAALPPFSITVKSGSPVLATITWTAPVSASGQPAASALAGYRVYYGSTVAGMTHVVDVSDPTETSYVIENLSTGVWYFAMTSYDTALTESVLSAPVAVTL